MGYRFITTSDRFAIRTIEVRDNRAVSDQEIAHILGVVPGGNIFDARLDDMVRRLERNPWIADALVRRSLPDALIVEIAEHRPAVLVELGGLYLADQQGRVFKRAAIERGEGAGLPIVTGLSREDYIERPDRVQEAVREALATVALYRAGAHRPALGEAHLHPRHGITLITHDSAVSLRLGRGEEALLKSRLASFDLVWDSLTPDERKRARVIYADDSGYSDRMTVAFNWTSVGADRFPSRRSFE